MSTATTTAPVLRDAPLSLTDRCDRCGSRAYVRASLPDGGSLLFCGHHGNEHRAALLVAGAAIHDETQSLTVTRGSSAA